MIKFEKKYLYTFADIEEAKKLIGKRGLFTDTRINENDLLNNIELTLEGILDEKEFQFKTKHCKYRYFYYDPNLECKRAYYLEGKQIQMRSTDTDDCVGWVDLDREPCWSDDVEYRIKPKTKKETLLTNREVAEWLAKGNGEIRVNDDIVISYITYFAHDGDNECKYLIRKWSDSEWSKATIEYIKEIN